MLGLTFSLPGGRAPQGGTPVGSIIRWGGVHEPANAGMEAVPHTPSEGRHGNHPKGTNNRIQRGEGFAGFLQG